MAILTTKKRKSLKSKTFGLPEDRKYPMPDKAHAANAKARATQQRDAGNLSADEKAKIFRKANKILADSTKKSAAARKAGKVTTRGKVTTKKGK